MIELTLKLTPDTVRIAINPNQITYIREYNDNCCISFADERWDITVVESFDEVNKKLNESKGTY